MASGWETSKTSGGSAAAADDVLQRAVFALNNGRPVDAERLAGDVLKADPRHARALHIFGCALLMQGHAREAIAPLEAAVRGRHDAEIETELAMALRGVGENDEALTQLRRITKRYPTYALAFRELGYLLSAMEHHDEAIDALARSLELAPMMTDLAVKLGLILLHRRKFVEARSAFARALNIAPGLPDALFGMAKAHQEIGENETAADYFRQCLMKRPNDAETLLALGHCLLELGQRDAGYDCFRMAARGNPQRYGNALNSLAAAARGRFWLKPSAASRYLRDMQS